GRRMPPLSGSHFGNTCPWTSVSADATIAAAAQTPTPHALNRLFTVMPRSPGPECYHRVHVCLRRAAPLLADEVRARRLHHRRPRTRRTDELGGRTQLPGAQLHARRDAGGRPRALLRVQRRAVG